MMEKINSLYKKYLNILNYYYHNWIMVIQKILLRFLLILVYFFVIGSTKFIMIIFRSSQLNIFRNSIGKQTYWKEAVGYGYQDKEKLLKQS